MSAFSKVNLDDLSEDEDEERRTIGKRAIAKCEQAQRSYNIKNTSQEDSLRLFADADSAFAPLLDKGFGGLQADELEALLKCRLHQAALTAMINGIPDKWLKVKGWCTDVLQFDSTNCHAHWLLAFSLQNGDMDVRPGEVERHMLKAIEYAKLTGKPGEAEKWQVEYERLKVEGNFRGDVPHPVPAAEEVEDSVRITEIVDVCTPQHSEEAGGGRKAATEFDTSKGKPVLQRGFFNKPPKASSSSSKPVLGPSGLAPASSVAASTPSASSGADGWRTDHERKLIEQRQQIETLSLQLAEKESQLLDITKALSAGEQRCSNAEKEVTELKAAMERADEVAAEASRMQQSGRAWSESQHQCYLDLSTEVLTLKAMIAREHRDRQDASNEQVAELRELAKRVGDLKGLAKALREHAKFNASVSAEKEADVQQMADCAMDFRRLTFAQRLAALASDAVVLKLCGGFFLLGALLVLALFVEGFARLSCAFSCAR